jgi:hypothetical protein
MEQPLHPIDELAEIRERIKALQRREQELREKIIAMNNRHGQAYVATVADAHSTSVNIKDITRALGEKVVAPFLRTTHFKRINLFKIQEKKSA